MAEPLVAVITRTRDRSLFLQRAIDSVSHQSFADLVQVIVNDGGAPEPVDAIAKRARHRVQVEHLPTSVGRGAAANLGLARSRSTLVVFLDDDDTWEPGFLARVVAHWKLTGRKAVVARATTIFEEQRGPTLLEVSREPFFPELESIGLLEVTRASCFVNHAFLAERSAIEAAGGYDETLPLYEDWDFNLRFLERFDIAFLREPLANYHRRTNADGVTANSFAQGADAADARAVLINRWLRKGSPVGLLLALGPTLQAVSGVQERVDKLFNLLHGVRQRWPMRTVEGWLKR